MMELRVLPPLVAFEVNLVLGAFALARLSRGPVHGYFAGFALSAAVWCLGAMLYFFTPESARELSLRMGFVGGAAAPVIYFLFCRWRVGAVVRAFWVWILAAVLLAAGAVANLDLLLAEGGALYVWVSGFQVVAVSAYFGAVYLAAFIAIRAGLYSEDLALRRESAFIFYGAAVPFVLMGAYTGVVWLMPWLPRPNVLLPVMVGAELMLYWAVRFKKVEAEDLLSRSLLYLIYTIVLTGILFLGLFGAAKIFDFSISTAAFIALVGFCLVSAFAFAASRDRIQEWVDREFFPEKYEYERTIAAYEDELSEARDRLHRAERLAMLGELSARVAHEIKNPLGPIKGYARILKDARARGEVPTETLDKAVGIIMEEADKIDERVGAFLDLARRERPARERTDLHSLIDKTVLLIEPAAGLTIVRDFQADSAEVFIDPARLQGAIYNVLVNAVEAMDGKGEIRIATRDDGRDVAIAISDNGPGIAPDLAARVFEPFVSGKEGGTGLGLAIARSIVEAHGGRMEVASGDGGAVFTIFVPGEGRKNQHGDTEEEEV